MFTKIIEEQDYVPNISHNVPIKYFFNKIDIKNDEKLVNLTICIELPYNMNWCENYKHNMLKTFKIVANNHFCFNVQDYIYTTSNIAQKYTEQDNDSDDNNVYISIRPHDRFKFHMFIFENAYTELELRPMALSYTGPCGEQGLKGPRPLQTFRPVVKLLVDVDKH